MRTQYRVKITGVNAATPSDGFIDKKTIEHYMQEGSAPTTYAQSEAKERANIRFDFLQQQLQLEANLYITNFVATGASATDAASEVSFVVEVERGDAVLFTRDELQDGAALTGKDAIARWVARALTQSRTTFGDIYDPTKAPTLGNETPAARYGVRVAQIVVGALSGNLTAATALVTVEDI